MLSTQYEALMKEITEKSQMMDDQILEKATSSGNIETEMTEKIYMQECEIKKQIVVYLEQTQLKQKEEQEMSRVLADYKGKYEEFSKAMKKSRETFKVYEGEIKTMN